jgi:hypothetical protein
MDEEEMHAEKECLLSLLCGKCLLYEQLSRKWRRRTELRSISRTMGQVHLFLNLPGCNNYNSCGSISLSEEKKSEGRETRERRERNRETERDRERQRERECVRE